MATNARACVDVAFTDGSERSYLVSADKGIASRLPKMIGDTGLLSLWNDEESFILFPEQIKDLTITDLSEAQRAAHAGPRPAHVTPEAAA